MISVDGDTSTNDTVLLLANGQAENPTITEKGEDYQKFVEALHYINEQFAKKIAGDGEGATALVQATVINAKTKDDARRMAKSIICSSLTKCAIFGHDANWGRILCAMGYSGTDFDPNDVEVSISSEGGSILIFKDGSATDYSEDEATKILSAQTVDIIANLKMGESSATAYGCDLSYDYVKINADYRS
jgi:glutamate N-acetyltransferase/amino-acid N-acetyltransferase